MPDQPDQGPSALPDAQKVEISMFWIALRKGWADFLAAPLYGAFFGGIYVLGGLLMAWITVRTGQTYWLVLAAFGFPLLGPFAAIGLYEISHRRENGNTLSWSSILGVVYQQKDRQVPSICAIIVFIFLFWFFLAHMIFALFLGLTTMTNISSSYEVFLSADGLTMLAVGCIVGAILAFLIFAITVIGLPLLLDHEIDFVTAMITSFGIVTANIVPMLIWAILVVVLLSIGMIPLFLGLMVVLPVAGHASWHLYRQVMPRTGETETP